jgi:hypothetical protein
MYIRAQVRAEYVDAGRVTCVTPERHTPHDAHVAVANNGGAVSRNVKPSILIPQPLNPKP